jgi:hypothetical protein
MNRKRSRLVSHATKGSLGALGVLIGLGLPVGETSAELFCTTNTNAQSDFAAPFPATTLDLSGTVAGFQPFLLFRTTTANQRVRLIFNAEGSIGGAVTTWLDDTIFVDPVGAPVAAACAPSGSDNALVSGNGTASPNDGWFSGATQCMTILPVAGVHTARVVVQPFVFGGGGAPWRIDDLSLCVDTL